MSVHPATSLVFGLALSSCLTSDFEGAERAQNERLGRDMIREPQPVAEFAGAGAGSGSTTRPRNTDAGHASENTGDAGSMVAAAAGGAGAQAGAGGSGATAVPGQPAAGAGTQSNGCMPGFADCNGDLSAGPSGDACETPISANAKHCGACNALCESSEGVVATCESQQCTLRRLTVGASIASGAQHGTSAGYAFQQMCQANEIMTSLNVTTDGDAVYNVAVGCNTQLLAGTSDALTLADGTWYPGDFANPDDALINDATKTTELTCSMGAVTQLSGTTWYADATQISIKQLALHCFLLNVDAQGQVQSEATEVEAHAAGRAENSLETFTDTCPAGQVVVGLSGYIDSALYGLETHCAPLSVTSQLTVTNGP